MSSLKAGRVGTVNGGGGALICRLSAISRPSTLTYLRASRRPSPGWRAFDGAISQMRALAAAIRVNRRAKRTCCQTYLR